MPETRVYTTNRNYPLVRKALNSEEVWDWFAEYLTLWAAVDADTQYLEDRIDALAALIGPFTADYIKLQAVTDSTERTCQDYFNDFPGTGIVSLGNVTDNLDGTVTVAESVVYAAKSNTPGATKSYFTVAEKILTLIPGFSNFIVVDFSGTAPYEFEIVLDPASYLGYQNKVVCEIVYYETDGTVRPTGTTPGFQNFYTQFVERAFDIAEGKGYVFVERVKGAFLGTTGVRYTTLTSGKYWSSLRSKTSAAFDTSASSTMIRYYQDGVGGWTKQTGQTQLDNVYYDAGTGTLVAMNTGRFKCVSMYIIFDGLGFVELEGQAQYTSLALAEEEPRPTNIPPILANFSIYLGRYIVQQGNDTVITESAFTSEIGVGPVSSHNSLSNLNVDPLYQHYNSTASTVLPVGWEVTNDEFGSDSASVRLRNLTLLRTSTVTGDASDIAAGYGHVFSTHATTGLQRINVNTMELQATSSGLTSNSPLAVISNQVLLQLQSANLLVINVNTLEYETISQAHGTLTSLYVHPNSGKIYFLNTLGNLIILDATYPYAIAETHAIAGIVNPVNSIIVDSTETYAYIFEGPATSGSAYVKKISLSTWAVTATSGAIPTINATYGTLMWNGTDIALIHDNNASATTQTCDIYDTSLVLQFDGAVSITGAGGAAWNGLLLKMVSGSGTFDVKLIQLPSLVSKMSSHFDAYNFHSSVISQLTDGAGNRVVHSFEDFQRAAILTHNPSNLQGVSQPGDPGLVIANGELGEDEVRLGEFRPLTLLRNYPNALTDFNTFNLAYGPYLFFGLRTSDTLYKIDRMTGEILASVVPGSAFAYRGMIVIDDEVVGFNGSNVRIVNIGTFHSRSVGFTSGSASGTGGTDMSPNGTIIVANGDGTISNVTNAGNDSYSATDISPGGLTLVKDVICDDTYFYVIDNVAGYFIKKYDIATSTLQATSADLVSVNRGFEFVDDYIYYITATDTHILTKSLTLAKSIPHSAIASQSGTVLDGILYGINTSTYVISSYQLPSLTTSLPAFIDARGSNGLHSVESLVDQDGNTIEWTDADTGQAVRKAHNPALMSGVATVSNEGLTIYNGEYGTDNIIPGHFQDFENYAPFDTTDTNNRYIAVNDKYIAISTDTASSDQLVIYDKFSKTEVTRMDQAYSAIAFIDSDNIVAMSAADLDYIHVPEMVIYQNATITAGYLNDIQVGLTTGKVYMALGDQVLYRRALDGSSDATSTLPSMTNHICAFLLSDDEQIVFVIDANEASSGNVYLRIYDISTFASASLLGSLQLTATVNGELYSKLGWHDGYVVAKTTRGSTQLAYNIDIINVSDTTSPVSIFSSQSGELYGYQPAFEDGLIYRPRASQFTVDLIPSLQDVINSNVYWNLKGGYITDGERTVTPQQLLASVQRSSDAYSPAILFRDLTKLASGVTMAAGDTLLGANERYVAISSDEATDQLYVIDRITGELVMQEALNFRIPVFSDSDTLYMLSGANYYKINVAQKTVGPVTALAFGSTVYAAERGSDGNIYIAVWTGTNEDILRWTPDAGTFTTLGSISPRIGHVPSIHPDVANNVAYIIDSNSGGALPKIISLTDASTLTTAAENTSSNSGYRASMRVCGDYLYVSCPQTGLTIQVGVYRKSDLVKRYQGAAVMSGRNSVMADDLLYTKDETDYSFVVAQLPVLPNVIDASVNWQLQGGYITDGERTVTPQQLLASVQRSWDAYSPAIRSVDATDTVETYDRRNIIRVLDTRTANVVLVPDADVLAIEGFEFSVIVDYDASYTARIQITGSAWWECNGDSTSGRPLRHNFTIIDGEPIPEGDMPSYLSA